MGLAVMGNPNCAPFTVVFQLGYVTWLSALVASNRKSARSKERPIEAFRAN